MADACDETSSLAGHGEADALHVLNSPREPVSLARVVEQGEKAATRPRRARAREAQQAVATAGLRMGLEVPAFVSEAPDIDGASLCELTTRAENKSTSNAMAYKQTRLVLCFALRVRVSRIVPRIRIRGLSAARCARDCSKCSARVGPVQRVLAPCSASGKCVPHTRMWPRAATGGHRPGGHEAGSCPDGASLELRRRGDSEAAQQVTERAGVVAPYPLPLLHLVVVALVAHIQA